MSVPPQYKVNIHVATILSLLGLPAQAEERFKVEEIRVPDFVLSHGIVGAMIGEAEVGESEYDYEAIRRLGNRVGERFSDVTFKGYDYMMLLIYPRGLIESIRSLPEDKVVKRLMEEGRTVGLGIAVRGEAFQLGDHYIRWYRSPVRIIDIPQTLDQLVTEFFRELRRQKPEIRSSVQELVEGIGSIIENTANSLALIRDSGFVERLADIAQRLNIAWDQIKEVGDRVRLTVKLVLLMSSLIMMFHEIMRNERLPSLRPIDCNNLNIPLLADLFEELVTGRATSPGYGELNGEFIDVLRGMPANVQLNNAVQSLCREVRNNYVLIRRMGWDVLSMLYQRLLSETYRHAFATFYTKLPAAMLLAHLAVEKLDDSVFDPACGTGSLLLATVRRRISMIGGEALHRLYKEALVKEQPILDIASENILRRTAGLDALKPAIFFTALNLRMTTHGSPPGRLDLYSVPVGADRAGSLDLLVTDMRSLLPDGVKRLGDDKYDVVIMNPPFTRSDRISFLIGEDARERLLSAKLYFGRTPVEQLFTAGMAKPFMVLADRLVREGGRIAAVLPNSILSRPSWRDVREELLGSYSIEYVVISWAPGTPNFSSDTQFREILLVARKKGSSGADGVRPLRIVNLYKRVDDLTAGDVERIAKTASATMDGVTVVVDEDRGVIASIVATQIVKEIKERLEGMGYMGDDLEKELKEDIERFGSNLYRLIAFKNAELLKLHLDLVVKCSVRFGDVFNIGSVIDHTSGIRKSERGKSIDLLHETPALWGSGERLGIRNPWLEKAPHVVGVTDEGSVEIKYWRGERTFYKAKMFMLRRARLGTQYVLMVRINEDSVSNVWWPLKPMEDSIAMKYLVYMNSIFGFTNILGERLETEGLFIELKKEHLIDMPVPDLRKAGSPVRGIDGVLRNPMPRFDQYIEYMAQLNKDLGWHAAAQKAIERAEKDTNLRPYANRAVLDLESYRVLSEICQGIEVPGKLYVLLKDEIETLRQVMEHMGSDGEAIEDKAEKVGKRAKHTLLDRWLKSGQG